MLIVDTGPILAQADQSDPAHAACLELLATHQGPLVTTAMVIAEAAYLMCRQLGAAAEVALYDDVVDGSIRVEALTAEDWVRTRQLVAQYKSLPLGGTDASLIAIAERLRVREVATLDRRHFGVVRPRHVEAFVLLPTLS